MEGMELKGRFYRIKKCVADLLAMEDDVIHVDEDDDGGSWELIGRELCLKSMFLYFDLNLVISGASGDEKKALTVLGNDLFHCMEELDCAVKGRSISLTKLRYREAAMALQDMIPALTPSYDNQTI